MTRELKMSEKENLTDISTLGSLDCVDHDLWLGNFSAASDLQILEERKIHSILTVNSFPLPKNVTDLEHIQVQFIQAFDTPKNDLLSYFEETYQFIENGLKKGTVLVHCCFGVSRSATIVIAYLMKKKDISLKAALEFVKCKRPSIDPNEGFLAQLKLYERMNCRIDINNIQYSMFKLYIAMDYIKKENALPHYCSDVIKPDPVLVSATSDPIVYKCKRCRRLLARGFNIIPHSAREKFSWSNSKWTCDLEKTKVCEQAYFIEPLAWMHNVTVDVEGKLNCPNTACRTKLGSYNWITGCQCPCGTNVSPGFYINPSKVDKQNFVYQIIQKQ